MLLLSQTQPLSQASQASLAASSGPFSFSFPSPTSSSSSSSSSSTVSHRTSSSLLAFLRSNRTITISSETNSTATKSTLALVSIAPLNLSPNSVSSNQRFGSDRGCCQCWPRCRCCCRRLCRCSSQQQHLFLFRHQEATKVKGSEIFKT